MNQKLNNSFRLNVLCGGSSAIMLAFAHVHPELWFISFFALVPFLWRLCHVNGKEAVALGMILATTYVLATSIGDILLVPKTFLVKLFSLNAAFAVFGLAINRVKTHLGFNPLFIALLWFPLGFVLIQYAGLADVFYIAHAGPNLVIGFGSLFGVLLWSCVIILGNSLILLFARLAKRQLLRRSTIQSGNYRRVYTHFERPFLSGRWYCVPNRRAPPLF
jgi:hypothetical protein